MPEVEMFDGIANVILAILRRGLPKGGQQLFLFILSNLVETLRFDEKLNAPEIEGFVRSVLFSVLDPSRLRPALWTLLWVYQRNKIKASDVVQRLLFLIAFHDDAHVAALACDTVGMILRGSSDIIELDLRPGIGKVLFEASSDRPIWIRKAALNALSMFASAYPEYVSLLVEHGLIPVLREMLDFDDWVLQVEALLLLDCIFANENGTDLRTRFAELDGMSAVEDLLDSQIPDLSDHAEAFLLTWNSLLEIDPLV
jgi:hypothetical protein